MSRRRSSPGTIRRSALLPTTGTATVSLPSNVRRVPPSSGASTTIGAAVKAPGIGLRLEREPTSAAHPVEAQLLQPRQPAASEKAAGARVDMADEVVAQPQHGLGLVGVGVDVEQFQVR